MEMDELTDRDDVPAAPDDIGCQIAALTDRVGALGRECAEIGAQLATLEQARARPSATPPDALAPQPMSPAAGITAGITAESPPAARIALFHALFRGRADVFPRRWESGTTGKAGYAPCAGSPRHPPHRRG